MIPVGTDHHQSRKTCPMRFSRLTPVSAFPLRWHANFSNLQRDSDFAGDARAAARVEFQSLVDVGALCAPRFSTARSRALEPNQSQPSPHAPTLPPIAPGRTFTRQDFSPRAKAGFRGVRE